MIGIHRVIVVVQARMSSTRLPGKVLMPLAGEPAIVRMIERVRRIVTADAYVVATSSDPSDDWLVEVCDSCGIPCSRGPLDDVLGRVLAAAPPEYSVIVRLTGDCPLIDPELVDQHLRVFQANQAWCEYATNAVVRTYPDGLDVEVMRRDVLEAADRHARAGADREHVTPWVQRHARTMPIAQDVDLSALRWVLDTASDYDALSGIYAELYPRDETFDSRSVYAMLLKRPDLIRLAGAITHDEAMARIQLRVAMEARA